MRRLLIASSLVLCLPMGAALADVDAGDVATSAGVSASLYSALQASDEDIARAILIEDDPGSAR